MPPQQFSPHPVLANHIQHYWYAERDFAPDNGYFDILPDTRIELIFSVGATCYTLREGTRQPLEPYFIVGILGEPVRIYAEGLIKLICVRFYPWGFYSLFADKLDQPAVGLREAGSMFQRLAERIQTQFDEGVDAAVQTLQSFLIEQALRYSLVEPQLVKAAQQIIEQKGNLSLDELASRTALSPRSLRRKFTSLLGLAPKSLARTARFEMVRDALWQNPEHELSDLALTAGYADQAHMHREFRQYSGRTPRRFAGEMRVLRQKIGRNVQ